MPNRLINQKSAYLRQHANNPVNWYPWHEEAFQSAQTENKPIFLSIGYSACHWCHVMEAESFQNTDIADLLNKYFVSIKVDKEEMPDIDHIYMSAVQALTGSGGWPLSVFLTPDLKPFYGGTYYPPYDKPGFPGFKTILSEIAMLWKNRPDKVKLLAEEVLNALKQAESETIDESVKPDAHNQAYAILSKQFDSINGGFGTAPKFPMPMTLEFLLSLSEHYKNNDALNLVQHSCQKMATGGIYDQIGGGFFRYSVDAQWRIPHFEKMLYLNAQLCSIYLLLFVQSHDSAFKTIALETLNYMDSELQASNGMYYASQDADSEGEEGKYYLWTQEEVINTIGKKSGPQFCSLFNIDRKGNFKENLNVPYTSLLMDNPKIKKMLKKLLEARNERIPPLIDNKILTDWNALALSSLILAYNVTSHKYYLERAQQIYSFITQIMFTDNTLYHCWIENEISTKGYIDDYAFFIKALIDLYICVQEKNILDLIRKLTDIMISTFHTKTGDLIFSAPNTFKILDIAIPYDSATPSGMAVAALVLFKLNKILDSQEYLNIGRNIILKYASRSIQAPLQHSQMLLGLIALNQI